MDNRKNKLFNYLKYGDYPSFFFTKIYKVNDLRDMQYIFELYSTDRQRNYAIPRLF